jgi:hypothetical protein
MMRIAHKQKRDGVLSPRESRPIVHVTDKSVDYCNAIRRLAPLGSYRINVKKSLNGYKNN